MNNISYDIAKKIKEIDTQSKNLFAEKSKLDLVLSEPNLFNFLTKKFFE